MRRKGEPSKTVIDRDWPYQIALPADYQPNANVFEQFLFSIGYSSEPVAFEVIGSATELVVQVTASASDAGALRQQLKAFFAKNFPRTMM